MFVQLQFDQEARRAMILQIDNFKGHVIFLSWFLEENLLSDILISLEGARSDIIGITRNTGAGDEYIFFSEKASEGCVLSIR